MAGAKRKPLVLSPPQQAWAASRDSIELSLVEPSSLNTNLLVACLESVPGFKIVGRHAQVRDLILELPRRRSELVILGGPARLPFDPAELKTLKTKHPHLRLILLSRVLHSRVLTAFLQSGAEGFFHEKEGLHRLPAAVWEVHQTGFYLSPLAARIFVRHLRQFKCFAGEDPGLSARETDILHLVGQGLTNQEIADALHISESTVKTHLHHVFQKLDVPSRAAALRSFLGP